MKYQAFILLPSFETNTYLFWDEKSKEAMLIDPAAKSEEVIETISKNELNLVYIINTHGHGDHIGGNHFFKERYPDAKLGIHREDAPMLKQSNLNLSLFFEMETVSPEADFFLEDGSIITLGEKEIKIIHTPGHTKGCVSLLCGNLLFSGDTLFLESVGRTDFPGGSYKQLVASIKDKLFILPDDTIVLPGHGYKTTIGYEKKVNPFITD